MFHLFNKPHKRLRVLGDSIFIDNVKDNMGRVVELETVFNLTQTTPEIRVYENNELIRLFRIDALNASPNLAGQFLHSSIRVLKSSAVMIDGVLSKSDTSFPKWTDADYEAIRFQPFFLSNADSHNIELIGKGLFQRGLHFNGKVTPETVRCICICDHCKQSFSLQHFHAGFSEMQYFYSTNSKETLVVPYGSIANIPTQLQQGVDKEILKEVESKLPKSSDGEFRYYNPLKCPHCLTPFIDFEKYKDIRANEYYGNTLLNNKPKLWTHEMAS